jgi:replicative DNA helicase
MSDFDVGFQRSVLRLAMLQDEFAFKVFELVDASFFTTQALGWIFTTMKKHFQHYQQRCSEVPLRNALRHESSDKLSIYMPEVETVISLGVVPEEKYIKEELREFCRRAVFAQAHREAATFFNQGKHLQAYDVMRQAQERIEAISFDKDQRIWFFEEFDQRQLERQRKAFASDANAFSTGILELDNATDGGIHRGEVWDVVAYAKVGKTTWLCNQGFTTLRVAREPVLHIQLEGKADQTTAKYDTLFSGELYANVRRGSISSAMLRELQVEYMRMRKMLVIRVWNDWDVNILKVEAELAALKSQGFEPAMLILDYVDLMRSRNKRDSELAHQTDAARDLKTLTVNYNLATHTASQAQRPKDTADEVEHIVKAAQIAEAYAKVRVFDFVGSLNATREEREQGKMRLFAELHRDNPMGRLYALTNDLSRMRVAVESEVRTPSSTRTPASAPIPSSGGGKKRRGS